MRIGIQGVTKRFGTMAAVNDVKLTIQEGELFTLLGPSGCGKTTLLRLIAGFYAPDAGHILFDEKVVDDVPPNERGIGMVFQNFALWPHMTVAENVGYGLKLRGIPSAEIRSRVDAVFEKVKLGGFGQRYPGQLSGGQQQRVALARALVLNPQILLLDEPLSNLDAKIRVQVRQEIRRLQKELGITTMYVTHDQEEALTLSDRIAVFNQGQILQIGAPKGLYERPESRFVADFIGINNLIDGVVTVADPGTQRLLLRTAFGEMAALFDARARVADRCVLCIRPENASVDGGAPTDHNAVSGRISFAAYLGHTLRYDVDLGSGFVFKVDVGDAWHHQLMPIGTAVTVRFPASCTVAVVERP
jgi:spermidine/putrescine ABC transporter ATP-binding subunit